MEELDKVIDKHLDEAYFVQNQYGSATTYDKETIRKMLIERDKYFLDLAQAVIHEYTVDHVPGENFKKLQELIKNR